MSSWKKILELTARMHESAKNGEWEQMQQSEAKRKPILQAYFSDAPGVHESEELLEERLKYLLNEENAMISLARDGLQEVKSTLSELSRGKRAVDAYK